MQNTTFKDLPSVDQVMHRLSDLVSLNTNYIKYLIQSELESLRAEITKNNLSKSRAQILEHLIQKVLMRSSPNMVNLINGTGIVLHTGFGRAPLRQKSFEKYPNTLMGMSILSLIWSLASVETDSHMLESI